MRPTDPLIARVLDQAIPPLLEPEEWESIMAEARSRPERRRRLVPNSRRKLVIILAVVLLCVLVPLSALGVSQGWWFESEPDAPSTYRPAGPVVTITSGRVGRVPWSLVAFVSTDNKLCYGVTPYPPSGHPPAGTSGGLTGASGFSCEDMKGPQSVAEYGEGGIGSTTIVTGTARENVARVDVVEPGGEVFSTDAIRAPEELGTRARFFVVVLPPRSRPDIALVARNASGKVVGTVPRPPCSFCGKNRNSSNKTGPDQSRG